MTNPEGYKDPTAEQAIANAERKARKRQKIAGMIADLLEWYDKGLHSERIRNPEAWALYQVWKKYDGRQP